MATRKSQIANPKIQKKEMTVEISKTPIFNKKKLKVAGVVVLVAAGLGLFWWKTNSWPIVAVVNWVPVTRFEVNQQLYAQGGKQVLDSMVTQKLIAAELAKKNVKVTDADINVKLAEIQTQLGTQMTIDQALSLQGMTLPQFKDQLKFQMGLEKLVEPTTDSAKLRQEMLDLIQSLKDKAKVWVLK